MPGKGTLVNEQIAALKDRLQGGVVPAMATPLESDGYRVNYGALEQLIEFLIAAGVRALFIGGTTGEGILLAPQERQTLHERTLAIVNRRVPSLVHVGANTTAASVELARHAVTLGAEAIVAVTPHFYEVGDEALLAYYQDIAQVAPETPLLAYDIPQMAANGITPRLLPRLAAQVPTFAGLKSSRPDAQVIRQFIDLAPGGVLILAGNERVALGLLALGANGLISGLSTAVPEPFVAMTRAFFAGNLAAAQDQQRAINRILDLLPAGARIGALKTILAERGIAAGPAVPPRAMPSEEWRAWPQIQTILDEAGTRAISYGTMEASRI
jgi:dihydrodipicolinate synthase/N-acetylneuraminate lyase